jgi:hypothetical protein
VAQAGEPWLFTPSKDSFETLCEDIGYSIEDHLTGASLLEGYLTRIGVDPAHLPYRAETLVHSALSYVRLKPV